LLRVSELLQYLAELRPQVHRDKRESCRSKTPSDIS
jgi:hypothetical protein